MSPEGDPAHGPPQGLFAYNGLRIRRSGPIHPRAAMSDTSGPHLAPVEEPEPEFDVFLSYASEDTPWCKVLAERLRDEGVRVWFDRWQLQAGDHLLHRINDGLRRSRKMLAVWSPHYFADHKLWTLAEGYALQQPDVLARDRPLIPVLKEPCDIPPLFRNILHLDFGNEADYDLRFLQLLQALDLPKDQHADNEPSGFREHRIDRAELGRVAQRKGKRFEDEVAKLYELLGFEVKRDVQIDGVQIDLMIEQELGGVSWQAIVECKDAQVTSAYRDQIITQKTIVQQRLPACRWVAVSSRGFAADTRSALEAVGIDCVLYRDLFKKLVRLEPVVQAIVDDYERHVDERWQGDPEHFICPFLRLEGNDQPIPAIGHLADWMAKSSPALMLLLGDLGTGKTTLSRFFAYQLARGFLEDPLRHPAPVLIPLKKMRKEVSLAGIIIGHFAEYGVQGLDFSRFAHLLRLGKIILFVTTQPLCVGTNRQGTNSLISLHYDDP